MCKALANGYDCIKIDFGTSCGVPWEIEYTTGIFGGLSNLEKSCELNNQNNNCAISSCIVEGLFVYEFVQEVMFAGTDINKDLKVKNGFQREDSCGNGLVKNSNSKQVSKNQDDEIRCCGSYPNRFKYKPNGGKVECCEDGTTKLAGKC